MLNNVIKISFASVGCVTGLTLTRTFFIYQLSDSAPLLKIAAYLVVSIALALIFYSTGSKIIEIVMGFLNKMDMFIQKMTLYELTISSIGLIVGLVVANLVTIPINKISIIGTPLSITSNILFGCLGVAIATGKKNENIMDAIRGRTGASKNVTSYGPKILDTSSIIDGRIVDIARSGFLDGELVIPSFVLEELRHIADSADQLKRSKGRRGLDVLNMLQKELDIPVRTENVNITAESEVDSELLKLAEKLHGKVLTTDYNLNKVALFKGVPVLNVNELSNAVKPIALTGEDMVVQVIKDGKENGQGIGYLEDGTMIVIDGGRRHIGESLNVTVTSVLQTAAGRMIFAKPKYTIERVI